MLRLFGIIFGLFVITGGIVSGAEDQVPPLTVEDTIAVKTAEEQLGDRACDSEVLAGKKEKAVQEKSATLSALIDEALRNNGNVQAAKAKKDISMGKAHFERRGYFPRLNQMTHFETQPDKDNNGQTERYYRYGYGVEADQTVFDFGETRNKVRKEQLEALSEEEAARLVEADISYDVTEAYWRAVMYQSVVSYRQKSVNALGDNLKSVADRVKAKQAVDVDFKNAESKLAVAEQDLLRAENGLKIAKRQLLSLVGRNVNSEVNLADSLSYAKPEEAAALDVEAHPDMKRLRAAQDAAGAARKAAKAVLFPRLYLRGVYDYQRPEENKGELITNYGPEGYYYKLSLNVKVPIGYEWVAGKGKLMEAEARQRQLESQVKALSSSIKVRVIDARLRLDEAVKGMEVAQKRYGAAKAMLEFKQQRAKSNKATKADVSVAEDEFARAEIGRLRAIYDVKVAEAAVTHAKGLVSGK